MKLRLFLLQMCLLGANNQRNSRRHRNQLHSFSHHPRITATSAEDSDRGRDSQRQVLKTVARSCSSLTPSTARASSKAELRAVIIGQCQHMFRDSDENVSLARLAQRTPPHSGCRCLSDADLHHIVGGGRKLQSWRRRTQMEYPFAEPCDSACE